jgi:hypothetical protein
MTNEERQQIANICRAHDEFMIEAHQWLRRQPVSESNPDTSLVFKTIEDATPPAPQPEPMPSEGEPYPLFTDLRAGIIRRRVGQPQARPARRAHGLVRPQLPEGH